MVIVADPPTTPARAPGVRPRLWWSLLLLVLGVGLYAAPVDIHTFSGWPLPGLSALALLLTPARRRPLVVVSYLAVLAVPISMRNDMNVLLSAAGAATAVLPAWLTAHLLSPQGRLPLTLRSSADDARYVGVLLVSSVLSATMAWLLAMNEPSFTETLGVAVISLLGTLTSQLMLVPLAIHRSRGRTDVSVLAATCQRVLLVALLATISAPGTSVSVTFLMAPILGFAALRMSRLETFVQLIVVGVVTYLATVAGRGPFVDVPDGWPESLSPILFYVFLASLSLLIVPSALTIDRVMSLIRRVDRHRHNVEQLFSAATSTVILVTNATGRIVQFNSGATLALGWTAEEAVGRTAEWMMVPEDIRRHAEYYDVPADASRVWLAHAAAGAPRDFEFRHKDGRIRIGSVRLDPIYDDDTGVCRGYIAVGEDVTDKNLTHRALSKALDHEQRAVSRLVEADRVKQELVSNVSHELRTPITSIGGYAELLLDDLGDLSSPQRDAVERIDRNAQRLRLLVEDLLTLSRVSAGPSQLAFVPVDLSAMVREAAEALGGLLHDRRLGYRVAAADDPVWVLGDLSALERVVVNLISNAVKFTPDGGTVAVQVCVDGTQALLSVADTGIGVTPEDQEHLFTRFFRSSTATASAIPGSGIGLSLVQEVVTAHQGTVHLESTPGQGTTVSVRLPLHDVPFGDGLPGDEPLPEPSRVVADAERQ